MASTHYKIFCRYYHATVNKAVVNDFQGSEYTWFSKDTMNSTPKITVPSTPKKYEDLTAEEKAAKIDVRRYFKDDDNYLMERNSSGEESYVMTGAHDNPIYKLYNDLTEQEKQEYIDPEAAEPVLKYRQEPGTGYALDATIEGEDKRIITGYADPTKMKWSTFVDNDGDTTETIKMYQYIEDDNGDALKRTYTAPTATTDEEFKLETVTVSGFASEVDLTKYNSTKMTNKSYFDSTNSREKYFFTLDDYNANKDILNKADLINADGKKRVFENMFIRFEDFLLDEGGDTDKQLENLKNARALDSALNEITIRETVTDNPKFDMMFIYDGIAKEEAAAAQNSKFKTYNVPQRQWKYYGSAIDKLPKFYKQKLYDSLAAGEPVEGVYTSLDETNADVIEKPNWTAADYKTGLLVNSLDIMPAEDAANYVLLLSGAAKDKTAVPLRVGTDTKFIKVPLFKKYGNKDISDWKKAHLIAGTGGTNKDKDGKLIPAQYDDTIPTTSDYMWGKIENGVYGVITIANVEKIVKGSIAQITSDTYQKQSNITFDAEWVLTQGSLDINKEDLYGSDIFKKYSKSLIINFEYLLKAGVVSLIELWTFNDKLGSNTLDKAVELEESQGNAPYVYYDKFKRFEFSPWFVYSNCTSLKFAMDKAEELVNIVGVDNVIIGKVVDLTQYIEIA